MSVPSLQWQLRLANLRLLIWWSFHQSSSTICLIPRYLYGVFSGMSWLIRSWIHAMGNFIFSFRHSWQGWWSFRQVADCMVSIPSSMSILIDIANSSNSSHGHSVKGVLPSGTVNWNPRQRRVCPWWTTGLHGGLSQQMVSESGSELESSMMGCWLAPSCNGASNLETKVWGAHMISLGNL